MGEFFLTNLKALKQFGMHGLVCMKESGRLKAWKKPNEQRIYHSFVKLTKYHIRKLKFEPRFFETI